MTSTTEMKLPNSTLRRLSDTELDVAAKAQDIRGREVRDAANEKIGKVNDLLIDDREKRVRFLEVASGGVFGIGADKLLVPVDAVTGVEKDCVRISQSRDNVGRAPRYDPALVDEHYLTSTYTHYGYVPYWTPDYSYPTKWSI